MKAKLLIGYLIVIASLFLPTSLNKPHDDGAFKLKEVAHAETLKEFPIEKFESLDKVPVSNREIGAIEAAKVGWAGVQWGCLEKLWSGESGWNEKAHNSSSDAHGIPQSLPASKMASHGSDYVDNPRTQIRWGISYIQDRYNNPCSALAFWNSKSPHWY